MNLSRIENPHIRRPLIVLFVILLPVFYVACVLFAAARAAAEVTATVPQLPEDIARCWRGRQRRIS